MGGIAIGHRSCRVMSINRHKRTPQLHLQLLTYQRVHQMLKAVLTFGCSIMSTHTVPLQNSLFPQLPWSAVSLVSETRPESLYELTNILSQWPWYCAELMEQKQQILAIIWTNQLPWSSKVMITASIHPYPYIHYHCDVLLPLQVSETNKLSHARGFLASSLLSSENDQQANE